MDPNKPSDHTNGGDPSDHPSGSVTDATPTTPAPANAEEAAKGHAATAGGGANKAGGPETPNTPTPRLSELAEEEEEEEDDFLSGGLFNVENSPAFKYLEQLRSKKELPLEKVNELKEKLTSLHSYLLTTFEYEKNLMRKTKSLAQEVANQKLEMDKTESKAYADNSDIGELKRELIKCQNEVALSNEREAKLMRDIEDSRKHKQDLSNDIEEIRKHKADMLEPQLIAATKELKFEVIQRRHQVENLQKDLEEKQETYKSVLKEKERLDIERDKQAALLAKATEMPQRILKQSEVLRDAISSLVIENVKQTALGTQMEKELGRLATKRKEAEELKLDLSTMYEERRLEMNDVEKQCDDIFKEHEEAKEQLAVQKSERVRIDLSIKKVTHDIKREHDILLRTIREKESALKAFRRLEAGVNNIRAGTPAIREHAEDVQRHLDATKREEKHQKQQLKELRKEIDMAVGVFLEQESLEVHEKEVLQAHMATNARLERELGEWTDKTTDLIREVETMAVEKELRSRDLIRIQGKHRRVKEDVRVKEIAITDASKRCSESLNRLREFAALYDVVKNERNKYLNLIQATTQRAAEMKEKIKILSNEIEILRNEITFKDRELTKKRQENLAAYAIRDNARNEANKLLLNYREKREQIDQHLSRIESLNTAINAAEQDIIYMKNHYEIAVNDRNQTGLHLLDRNDELCILYEKLNVQEMVLKKGETELADREEEIRKLKLTVQELDRVVELQKKVQPVVAEYDREIEELQKEYDETTERMLKLSKEIESPNDSARLRNLPGTDPSQKDLMAKLKKLEERLAEKEEKLLEKDLILEEVSTLTNRLKKQTLNNRQESSEVTTKLNDLNNRLKYVTRSMMARVSELSMHQATASYLEQERMDKEAALKEALARLARGEPPSEDTEREFVRAERLRARRIADAEKAAAAAVEAQQAYKTTAEPRPNAYLPDIAGIDLPIPKPYGVHAPFKPTEQGSSMRHIRKPTIKPIEL